MQQVTELAKTYKNAVTILNTLERMEF